MSTVMTDPASGAGGQVPPAPRRLTRRSDRRVVAGVAGGLADYFAIDPVILRIAFVVLAVTGAGILLYLLGWLLIPRADRDSSIAERSFRKLSSGPRWIAAIVVVIGAVLLLSHGGVWAPSIVWGLALITLGVVLYTRDTEPKEAAADDEHPDATPPGLQDSPTPQVGLPAAEVPPSAAPPAPAAALQTPRPQRERSAMGWFVVGAVLAAVGLAAVLDEIGAISFRPVQYLALALAILGAGLFLSSWIGRARWLIVPSLLLLPFILAASLIHVPIRGGFGNHTYAPVTATDVRPEYRLIAGRLYLDLSRVRFGPDPTTVHVSVVAGQISVRVPHDVRVMLSGNVSAGNVNTFDTFDNGANVPVESVLIGPPRAPLLHLDLGVTFGQVEVDRAPALNKGGKP